MGDYTEHEKLQAINDKSQEIGEFIDWLSNEKGYHLGYFDDDLYDGEVLMPLHYSITNLLAEFFHIDLDKIETEKRAMLEAQRRLNER